MSQSQLWGVAIDPADFQRHPLHPSILLLNAQQYASLVSGTVQAPRTPHSVLFPYLHGADRKFSAHASYFLGHNQAAPPPNYAGLVTLVTDPSQQCSPSSCQPSAFSSSSSSSPISPNLSLSSTSSSDSDDTDSDSSPLSTSDTIASLPGGPEPRASLLVSSLEYSDVFGDGDLDSPDFVRPALPKQVSLRNFFLQPSQYASVSHVVVYDPAGATPAAVALARKVDFAQRRMRARRIAAQQPAHLYYTLLLVDPVSVFERSPSLRHYVAVDGSSFARNKVDFEARERDEMDALTRASLIHPGVGVWLGNAADVPVQATGEHYPPHSGQSSSKHFASTSRDSLVADLDDAQVDSDGNPHAFSICIETRDVLQLPDSSTLNKVSRYLTCLAQSSGKSSVHVEEEPPSEDDVDCTITPKHVKVLRPTVDHIVRLQAPSSTQIASFTETTDMVTQFAHHLIEFASWLTEQCQTSSDLLQCRALIYAQDGYTDSSVFALIMIMVKDHCTVPEAYMRLHCDQNRAYFVHSDNIPVLEAAEKLLSGRHNNSIERPRWYTDPIFDGSLPSRILPHLYLGSISHACNADLLRHLGITHVLSAGESALTPRPSKAPLNSFRGNSPNGTFHPEAQRHGVENKEEHTKIDDGFDIHSVDNSLRAAYQHGKVSVLELRDLSDDGIDPIEPYLEPALAFIDDARKKGTKVLVHCRVGVSRSATLAIAYCMRYLGASLVSSYLLVRSRRLNILIQPTILFLWTLHNFEIQEILRRIENAKTLRAGSAGATTGSKDEKADMTSADEEDRVAEALTRCRISWPYLARETTRLNAKYLA